MQLHNSSSCWHDLPTSAVTLLVHAFIFTRVNYCNSILRGLPIYQLSRLQMVTQCLCPDDLRSKKGEPISLFLKEKLHWLHIPERIVYKMCNLTFQALHNPVFLDYLAALVPRPSSTDRCLQLRSSRDIKLVVPPPSRMAKFSERSFKRGNPILWSALPGHVTRESNLDLFARKL